MIRYLESIVLASRNNKSADLWGDYEELYFLNVAVANKKYLNHCLHISFFSNFSDIFRAIVVFLYFVKKQCKTIYLEQQKL